MKSVNFKRKPSVLRYSEEAKKNARKPINWDRIIYFIFFGAGFLFLVNYLWNYSVYITAYGEVLFDKLDIRYENDCTLENIYVSEGDSIEIGDTLFSFHDRGDRIDLNGNETSVSITQSSGKTPEWLEREILITEKNIRLAQIQAASARNRAALLEREFQNQLNQVVLEVSTRGRLNQIEESIALEQADAMKYDSEAGYYAAYLAKLKNMMATNNNTSTQIANPVDAPNGGDASYEPDIRYFISPVKGTITNIEKRPYEVALRTEIILSVHEPENIYIKGYFDQDDLSELTIGDEVDVLFPDGTSSTGVIKQFYFATFRLPDEFQKKYEPTTRTLSADIYPVDETELKKWRAFYKMGVEIRKSKY